MSCCHQSYPYTTGYSEERISCICPVVISPIHIIQGTVRKELHVDVLLSSVLSIYYRVQWGKNCMWMSCCHQSYPYTTGYSEERISCRCPVVISPIHILKGYSEDRISCRCPVVISPVHTLQGTVRKEFHVDVPLSSVLSIYYRVQWGNNFL
jgi:hypothetical protein